MEKDGKQFAPFKKDGGLWHYAPKTEPAGDNLVWEEVDEWDARMKYVGLQRKNGTAFFLWADTEDNTTYPMFIQTFKELMKENLVTNGTVDGAWTVECRDRNYGLKLVKAYN